MHSDGAPGARSGSAGYASAAGVAGVLPGRPETVPGTFVGGCSALAVHSVGRCPEALPGVDRPADSHAARAAGAAGSVRQTPESAAGRVRCAGCNGLDSGVRCSVAAGSGCAVDSAPGVPSGWHRASRSGRRVRWPAGPRPARRQGPDTARPNWLRPAARNAIVPACRGLATGSQPRPPDGWRYRYGFSSDDSLQVC